jgi:hypothetical protein
MELLNRYLGWHLESIPSPNSIKNWAQKSGYSIYEEADSKDFPAGYAIIVDESMMVGSEKLLLTLGVPAAKTKDEAFDCPLHESVRNDRLGCCDVKIF